MELRRENSKEFVGFFSLSFFFFIAKHSHFFSFILWLRWWFHFFLVNWALPILTEIVEVWMGESEGKNERAKDKKREKRKREEGKRKRGGERGGEREMEEEEEEEMIVSNRTRAFTTQLKLPTLYSRKLLYFSFLFLFFFYLSLYLWWAFVFLLIFISFPYWYCYCSGVFFVCLFVE